MNKIILHLLIVLCGAYISFSQHIPSIVSPIAEETKYETCLRSRQASVQKQEHILASPSDIDVLSYDVFMDWRLPFATFDTVLPTYTYSGRNSLTIKTLKAMNVITLNGGSMKIDSVKFNNSFLPNTSIKQPENGFWSITLSNTIPIDTYSVDIWYTYIGDAKDGFYYYPKGMFVKKYQGLDSNFVEEDLAYVMSQPEDARYWMPCNDRPDDKARARITVRVPYDSSLSDKENIRVTSNGDVISLQIGTELGKQTFRDYTFYDTTLIPTYLMVVNASKFVDFTLWAKIPNSNDSIPIYNYVWKKDFDGTKTDGSEYNATYALSFTPSMISGYIPLFGPFPFKTYGHTAAQPFWAGGMEHQRMTTINRTWLRSRSANGLAHEIMHQWFGDLVTCETWGELWLNEGAGTWGEALWYETWGGYQEYISMMRSKRNDYFRINSGNLQPPIFGIPIENVFNYATTYAKASWVYHMLRTMLGDSTCYSVLRHYLKTYAYGNASTDMLKQTFKTLAPNPAINYDIFFDQWLMKRGHPKVKFATLREDINSKGEKYVHFVIQQTQNGNDIPDVFHIPITISFIGEKDTVLYSSIMKSSILEDIVLLPSALKKAIIDPKSDVLVEVDTASGVYLSVDEQMKSPLSAEIREFGEDSYVSIFTSEYSTMSLTIHDIRGSQVYAFNASMQPGEMKEIKLPHLTTGMYIVTIRTEHGVQTLRFLQ